MNLENGRRDIHPVRVLSAEIGKMAQLWNTVAELQKWDPEFVL